MTNLSTESRASVLDCGSPLPLSVGPVAAKRQRAAAVQNLAEFFLRRFLSLILLLWLNPATAQPLNDLVFTVGTTIQDSSGKNWAYVLLGTPQAQLLAGKRFAIYGKPGAPTDPFAFTLRGTVFQQTDANSINALLNQSVVLNEDLTSLDSALEKLLHNFPSATNLPLSQKVLFTFQVAATDSAFAQSSQLLSRQHPGLTLCAGQAFTEQLAATTTYEVRNINLATGLAGDVVGRVTITPDLPVVLPAPGVPFQVQTNAASDHLRIRLRWGTPDSLRRLALLQYGFNVWRISAEAAIAGGYTFTPPTLAQLKANFVRVNTGPVMATRDYAPVIGGGGPDDPGDAADRTTYFFADNNGRALGSISPTNGYSPPGYLAQPFNDGEKFYYFITARDVLGRDGLVSPGGPAMACRRLPPHAPTKPNVRDEIVPGTASQERLLITWQQNNNTNDSVNEYWVYRWPNPTMALTNDATPYSNVIAVVSQLNNSSANSAFDIDTNSYVIPGPKSFWYTVRAVSHAACQDLFSPDSPPVSGVLRQREAPPAPTGELVGSCGTPVAVFRNFSSLANPGGPDTNNWNYRITCQRRDSGIAWVQLVIGDPYVSGAQFFGPLYFPPDGDTLSVDFQTPVPGVTPDFRVTCYAGTYYGQVSTPAFCQNTNPVPPAQITQALFSCGELLFTALNSNDPFLQAVNAGQSACYPAMNPTPDASGTVRMQFDPAIGRPPMLIQFGTFTNTIESWSDLGVATADPDGFYSVFFEPCLIGPLPPFRGCAVNLPGEGVCDQHVARAGDGGAVAPIYIRFHPTPGMHEYRVYRSINGGEPTFVAQGAALYDPSNREIVRTDDTMPPSAARACYFVQALDENGNGSPLALIGCKDILPPKPPRPLLSEPAPLGDASNPQVALKWFCPTAGVYRFELLIRRADQPPGGGKPTGLISLSHQLIQRANYQPKARFYGLQSERLAVDLFDESQFTPPVGPGFGPGPQFLLNASIVPGVPYYISVRAQNAHGDWGDASPVWSFNWKPPPTIQTVPWPARPLTPVTLFDEPDPTHIQTNFGPRVAAILFTNSDGTLKDLRYPVGIAFAQVTPNANQFFGNIGSAGFAGYTLSGPTIAPWSPGVDPNTGIFHRQAQGPEKLGDPLLPIVVYRQQVTNANFSRVSGHLTQVSPLLERVPWTVQVSTNLITFDTVTVTIPDRLIGLRQLFTSVRVPMFLYLRDQQPVIVGARYHYYAVRLNEQREVAETIDAGTVEIPLHP